MRVTTYMSTLCNAHGTTKSALYLSHVYNAGDADHLQHAVVVSRSHELVITLRTPWVGPRRPAEYNHTHTIVIINVTVRTHSSRAQVTEATILLHFLFLCNVIVRDDCSVTYSVTSHDEQSMSRQRAMHTV